MWLKAVLINVILLLAIVMKQMFGDTGASVPDVSRKDLLRVSRNNSLCSHAYQERCNSGGYLLPDFSHKTAASSRINRMEDIAERHKEATYLVTSLGHQVYPTQLSSLDVDFLVMGSN